MSQHAHTRFNHHCSSIYICLHFQKKKETGFLQVSSHSLALIRIQRLGLLTDESVPLNESENLYCLLRFYEF